MTAFGCLDAIWNAIVLWDGSKPAAHFLQYHFSSFMAAHNGILSATINKEQQNHVCFY